MTKAEKLEYLRLLRERSIRESRHDLLRFTLHTMPNFEPADFHRYYYAILTDFAHGKIKKLMVFMPPQHGKSEGSTRRLPAYILGRDPDKKVAVVSYSAPKARKFNREIQRVIDSPEYREVFPDTRLNRSNVTTVAGSWLRNADECEIVGRQGGFKTVGVGGPLTGEKVDILIMDDIYKDAATAWSPTVRESHRDWYDTVGDSRLHNDSQQLIVFTRWHEDDLAGTLLAGEGIYSPENPNGWVVVKFQAIKTGPPTFEDPRTEGEALWPIRHSAEKLLATKKRNVHVFESLYQQEPKSKEGLLYSTFQTYEALPDSIVKIANYTDVADKGKDYLCSICYMVDREGYIYITDVVYTDEPMEVTQPAVAMMLLRNGIRIADIESNAGGRAFSVDLKRRVGTACAIKDFAQTANKESRILTNSATVMDRVRMPIGWADRFPKFYNDLSNFYRNFAANEHDDAADALTGCVEKSTEKKQTTWHTKHY